TSGHSGAGSREEPTSAALEQFYRDAIALYDRTRAEITFQRRDGRTQHYAPTRYRHQIEVAKRNHSLVTTIEQIIGRGRSGFSRIADANRPDLMVESLVLDRNKPYHAYFDRLTIQQARERMADYHRHRPVPLTENAAHDPDSDAVATRVTPSINPSSEW